jgi:UPF0755 protein
VKQSIKQLKRYFKSILDYWRIKAKKFRDTGLKIAEDFKKLPSRTKNFLLLILLFSLFFAVLVVGGKLYLHYQINHAFSLKEIPQIFVVSSGETMREIAQDLEKKGLIKNDLYFLIHLKILEGVNNGTPTIKAGKYLLSPNLNISQIAEKLINGSIISSEIKITIPEGYNIFEIGDKIENAGLVSLEEFLRFGAEHTIKNSALVPCSEQVPCQFCASALCGSVSSIEGYLFPDTYQFKKDSSIESIIKKMFNNFQQKTTELTQNLKYKTDTDIHHLITIASLLEKEVTSHYDRQVVAGIIKKRIEVGMPLQIDATVLYAQALNRYKIGYKVSVKNHHNPVSVQDTKLDSLYNTYKYKGLPPGPICNPGIDAIKAALNPIKTDYWYYLSTEDGKTIFSKTYEEHLTNKQKYLY